MLRRHLKKQIRKKTKKMKRNKTRNSSLGAVKNCINFELCPFCYGCRNYSSSDLRCQECYEDNKKFNICNTEKHKGNLISKLIKKTNIKL